MPSASAVVVTIASTSTIAAVAVVVAIASTPSIAAVAVAVVIAIVVAAVVAAVAPTVVVVAAAGVVVSSAVAAFDWVDPASASSSSRYVAIFLPFRCLNQSFLSSAPHHNPL